MSDLSLEHDVADLLLGLKMTIAVAESCTGGLISHRLTNISGSSGYFEMGLVTYSNRSKMALLGVSEDILTEEGAVSEACVKAMAASVKSLARSHFGLAVSGIAGPTGGSSEKPVGTVHVALAAPDASQSWRFLFHGSRQEIKKQTSDEALRRVREYLTTHQSS